ENLPPTGDNDVKVQVRACALSWIDTKLLSEVKLEKELLPVGREISGVVLEVGRKVSFFQPDDEVAAQVEPAISLRACFGYNVCLFEIKGLCLIFFSPGILPLDSEESGLCEVVLVHEHYLVSGLIFLSAI
ncbi:hypothetical protein CIB84_009175, partial [Bambusicola thoracicus]